MRTDEKTFEFHLNLPNEIIISDPCYKLETWCQKRLKIKEGEYIARVERFDNNDGWGTRNYILTINHISCPKKKATKYEDYVGVDSGQMGIYGVDYYTENQPKEEWYERVCKITLSDDSCGLIDEMGVVTESGCGDGGYDVMVGLNSKNEVVAVKISFL